MEADLYGCSDPCWWPAQVPDVTVNHKDWDNSSDNAARDWRSLGTAYPKDAET